MRPRGGVLDFRLGNLLLVLFLASVGVTLVLIVYSASFPQDANPYQPEDVNRKIHFKNFTRKTSLKDLFRKVKTNDEFVRIVPRKGAISSNEVEETDMLKKMKKFMSEMNGNDNIFSMNQDDPKVWTYIRNHHLTPRSELAKNLTDRKVRPNYFSALIDQMFSGRNGTFIEAGAYDGEAASNSLFLEHKGWQGILVECNPIILPILRSKNRHAWITDVCLSLTDTPQMLNFSTPVDWAPSARLGRAMNSSEMKDVGIDWIQNKTWLDYQLPCFPLYSIIKAVDQFREIDFLSLDVEGAELAVLKHFPFEKIPIKVILVEVHTFSKEQMEELGKLMTSNGYELLGHMDNDNLYALKSFRLHQSTGDLITKVEVKKVRFVPDATDLKNEDLRMLENDRRETGGVFSLNQTDPKVWEYVRNQHLTQPSVLPYNLTKRSMYRNFISSLIFHLLDEAKSQNGTFVEAGAYDGETDSNTLFLEKHGWQGILVECNPIVLPTLRYKNRKAWISDACLSLSGTPQKLNFSSPMNKTAAAIGMLGRPMHLSEKITDPKQNQRWIEYEIPCFPLFSIIKAVDDQLTEIDFLNLDIGGFELSVLKHFPFDLITIKLILVNTQPHTKDESRLRELEKLMVLRGYVLLQKMKDDNLYGLKSLQFEL